MNLKNSILAKIEELGIEESMKYFGKKKQAITLWKSTGKVPLDAAQRVLDDAPPQTGVTGGNALTTNFVTEQEFSECIAQLSSRITSLERNEKASQDLGAPAIAHPAENKPSYGFSEAPPSAALIPPNVQPISSQTPQPNQPPPNTIAPVVQGNGPYLPNSAGSWAKPHATPPNNRI